MDKILEIVDVPEMIFNHWLTELDKANEQINLILNEKAEYDIVSVFSEYNSDIMSDFKNSDFTTKDGLIRQLKQGISDIKKSKNKFFQIKRFVIVNGNIALIRTNVEIKG